MSAYSMEQLTAYLIAFAPRQAEFREHSIRVKKAYHRRNRRRWWMRAESLLNILFLAGMAAVVGIWLAQGSMKSPWLSLVWIVAVSTSCITFLRLCRIDRRLIRTWPARLLADDRRRGKFDERLENLSLARQQGHEVLAWSLTFGHQWSSEKDSPPPPLRFDGWREETKFYVHDHATRNVFLLGIAMLMLMPAMMQTAVLLKPVAWVAFLLYMPIVLAWPVLIVLAIAAQRMARRRIEAMRRVFRAGWNMDCDLCGYNLSATEMTHHAGAASKRCSECGHVQPIDITSAPAIPGPSAPGSPG